MSLSSSAEIEDDGGAVPPCLPSRSRWSGEARSAAHDCCDGLTRPGLLGPARAVPVLPEARR
ncbi:hypothetical protein ACFFX0_02300 [Citricoccus parietis]|uniref:Uncharacterized protein n=1 Tax=Citricoccus parietis TaxID=592307 RepID=A0ABV5FUG1_9MICC